MPSGRARRGVWHTAWPAARCRERDILSGARRGNAASTNSSCPSSRLDRLPPTRYRAFLRGNLPTPGALHAPPVSPFPLRATTRRCIWPRADSAPSRTQATAARLARWSAASAGLLNRSRERVNETAGLGHAGARAVLASPGEPDPPGAQQVRGLKWFGDAAVHPRFKGRSPLSLRPARDCRGGHATRDSELRSAVFIHLWPNRPFFRHGRGPRIDGGCGRKGAGVPRMPSGPTDREGMGEGQRSEIRGQRSEIRSREARGPGVRRHGSRVMPHASEVASRPAIPC